MEPVQLTFSATTRHPLFPDEARRREALHAIGRVASGCVVIFAIVDDHVHLVLWCERAEIGRLAQALFLALRAIAATGLEPAHVSAVEGRSHMESLVRYFLEQPMHHGLSVHPALTTGSCFPDLVGARRIPGLQLKFADALPRWSVRDTFPIVGIRRASLEPASDLQVRAAGARRVVTAAAFATGALAADGRDPASILARRVACELAAQAKIHPDELAFALDITRTAIRRIADREVAPDLVTAARMRITLGGAAVEAATAVAVEALLAARRARKTGPNSASAA